MIFVNGFMINYWVHTQHNIAQSLCEAEVIALNVGAMETLFVKSLLVELGVSDLNGLTPELLSDSSNGKHVVPKCL